MKLCLFAAAAALSCVVACSSTSPPDSGATSADAGDAGEAGRPVNPLGCPVDRVDGCPYYYCACQAGASNASTWSDRFGSCAGPEATCADFCTRQASTPSPATELRCGVDPKPPTVDAGLPRGTAGGPCLAGDVCSERDYATCADITVQLMRSACPASGVCPTKAEAEATACVGHGGPQRI